MNENKVSSKAVLIAWTVCTVILPAVVCAAFTLDAICSTSGVPGVVAYLLCGGIGLAAFFAVPSLLIAAVAEKCVKFAKWHCALWLLSAFTGATLLIILFSDFCIYRHFSFHINGFVINLLITPGGFGSMGLDSSTVVPAFVAAFLCYLLYFFGGWCFSRRTAFRQWCSAVFNWPCRAVVAMWLIPLLCLTYAETAVGVADFYQYRRVMSVTGTYPLLPRVRMRRLMKSLGFEQPPRTAADRKKISLSGSTILNYPLGKIKTVPVEKLPNVVWLCSESLRNDMLCAEVMPNSNDFAEKYCIRYNNHFSGGNGTRPGMFSMFYAVYANLWEQFLDSNRPPVFFEWLRESNYQMRASTSAKFTYPEFDRTVFAMLENSEMEEINSRLSPPERDKTGVDKMLEFIKKRDTSRPFFAFHFFEGTHAPYTFDPDKAPFKPVLENLSYLKMSEDDREPVLNRARNAAYNVDLQIGRVLNWLVENGMLENTIVIITGDHGEEFYEHGHLGHNSTYVDEQICPPLVMHLPGVPAGKYERLSQHTDIVPTLARFLGRVGDPQLYSVGNDLLNPAYDRQYMIVCGYSERVLVNQEGKFMLPVDANALYSPYRLLRRDDSVDEDIDGFYLRHAAQMSRALKDMQRFLK